MRRRTENRAGRGRAVRGWCVVALAGFWAAPAAGQFRVAVDNPVFFDDSTAAGETLERLGALVAAGNTGEAVRALQRLLDEEPERLHTADGEVFVTVRQRVHGVLLDSPTLLERYREVAEATAAAMLEAGDHRGVERSRLLTRSGFEAALRVAQEDLEAARFGAASRVLAQLEAHPDRRLRGMGAEAAALAAMVSDYTGAPEDRERAVRWAAEAGMAAPEARPVPLPPGRGEAVVSGLGGDAGSRVEVAGIVPTPMRSAPTTPEVTGADEGVTGRVRAVQPVSWSIPAAVGDVLYINDGVTVSALDRFTLHPIWRARTLPSEEGPEGLSPLQRRLRGRIMDDACSVTVAGDRLLATTGTATSGTGRREGDGRLHAFDRATGRVLWSADVSSYDEALSQSSVRGPATVVGDTVVVVVRKSVPNRRLVSLYAVGLDLATGEGRWWRLLATAGSLPFQQYNRVPQAFAQADGVVYRCEEIGVVAALEAHGGRPLWVRRVPAGNAMSNEQVPPWNTSAPVVAGGSLLVLSPARDELLVIDRASGEITARRALAGGEDAQSLGEPHYLLAVGGHVAAVGQQRVAFVPLDDPAGGQALRTPLLSEPGIRGRCAVSGGELFVPVEDAQQTGVLVVDPARPRSPRTVGVEHVGNVLALDGQLVIVDEAMAHSYLAWASASALLERRIADDPGDATAAVTLAELAYHAGHPERIAPAVDAAMEALRRRPDAGVQRRLFEGLLAMLGAWLEPEGPGPAPDASMMAGVSTRLDALATTPEQRVAQRMLAGRLGELRGDAAQALAAYQSLLADEALASAAWRGSRLEVRAELEATRRIAALLREVGIGAYAPFNEAALRQRPAGPDSARRLAAAYPFAGVAPAWWLEAGDALRGEDRPFAAMRAWRAGLDAARTIVEAGGGPDLAVVGELVGRLCTALAAQGRLGDVGPLVASARGSFGAGLVVLERSGPLDVEALLEEQGRRLAQRRDRPLIGTRPVVQAEPILLPGLVLEPVRRSGEGAFSRALLISGVRGELTAVGIGASGEVAPRWVRPVEEGVVPVVIEDTDDRVVLFWPPGGGSPARVEALDQATGATVWTSRSMGEMFAAMPGPARADRMVLPGGFDAPVGQVLVAAGERTVCLVERGGRAAAIDLRDGSTLWARELEIRRIADAVLSGGVLVVGGMDRSGADVQPGQSPVGMVVAYEERTGQRLQRMEQLGGRVRWVRATETGEALVGADRAVSSLNLAEGRLNWSAAEPFTEESLDAWVFGDRLVLLTADRGVRGVSVSTGRVDTTASVTRGRIDGSSSVTACAMGERVVLASGEGVVVLGPRGEVLGIDALDAGSGLVPAACGEGVVVTIEPRPLRRRGEPVGELHLLSAESAKLLASVPLRLPETVAAEPTSVHLLDGHALVGFGTVTMVVPVPVEEAGVRSPPAAGSAPNPR